MQMVPFIWVVLYGWHLLFNIKDLISPFPPLIRLLNSLNPDIALAYALGFICQHETLGWLSNLFVINYFKLKDQNFLPIKIIEIEWSL